MLLSEIAVLDYDEFNEKIKYLSYEELKELLGFVSDIEKVVLIHSMMRTLKNKSCSSIPKP